MKNKIFKIIACLILCCTFIMLTSCAKGEEEKYSLCEMDFFGVDVAAYEYNDIYINKTKHTYKVENKVKENGIVTTQKGKCKVSKTEDGKEYIEVTSSNNGVKFLLEVAKSVTLPQLMV